MKVLPLVLAFAAGATCVLLLGVAQLIWARSEASYYLQLALTIALLGGLFFAARSASTPLLAAAIAGVALIAALMPLDSSEMIFSKIAALRADPREGEVMEIAGGWSDWLTGVGGLWLIHAALLAVLAYGGRQWWKRQGAQPHT